MEFLKRLAHKITDTPTGRLTLKRLQATDKPAKRLGSAENTEASTGLALHPGLRLPQKVDSPICHSMSKMNLHYPGREASMTEYLSWYKEKLSGFKFVSSSWSNRSHNAFYSQDGTKLVSITGNPQGDSVYTVNYVVITPAHSTRSASQSDES